MSKQPTNLSALRPSEQSMSSLMDRAARVVEVSEEAMMEMKPYRIQFAAHVVGPQGLPPFAYVTSAIGFDHVVYTAVVQATSLDDACNRVALYWPHAEFREAEEGVNAFRSEDTHLTSRQFGAIRVTHKPTFIEWLKSKLPTVRHARHTASES